MSNCSAWAQQATQARRRCQLVAIMWRRIPACIHLHHHSQTTQHNKAPQCEYFSYIPTCHPETITLADYMRCDPSPMLHCCSASPEVHHWQSKLRSKGSFYFECDTLISHQYQVFWQNIILTFFYYIFFDILVSHQYQVTPSCLINSTNFEFNIFLSYQYQVLQLSSSNTV